MLGDDKKGLSANAKELHELVYKISRTSERDLNFYLDKIKRHIDNSPSEILLECGFNNTNYLINAIYLAFKNQKNKALAEKISYELISLLIRVMKSHFQRNVFEEKI